MTTEIAALDEQHLAGFTIGGRTYAVTTSGAPDTVRVYDVTGTALTAADPPMVCTITGVWKAERPAPSFAAEYIDRDETWRWHIVAETVTAVRPQHRAGPPSPRAVDPTPP